MKDGDLVRFQAPHWMDLKSEIDHNDACGMPWLMGLLIEYHAWEKVATIAYGGQLVRVQARAVEKAGKKDFSSG